MAKEMETNRKDKRTLAGKFAICSIVLIAFFSD
jgi:hypothetical protein